MPPVLLGLIPVTLGVAAYALLIEPGRFAVTQLEIPLRNLPGSFDGIQFVHVTDLHGLAKGARAERVIDLVRAHMPRPILFTGDVPLRDPYREEAWTFLRRLRELGEVYMVLGNHDLPRRRSRPRVLPREEFEYIGGRLRELDIRLLFNRACALERGGERLWLAGVDDPDEGEPQLDCALEPVGPGECVILLAHSPDIHPVALDRVDLILSGHTHGGQIRIPLFGALVTRTRVTPRHLCMGLHSLSPRTRLFVSRGLGVSRLLPARFLCPPELSVITLRRLVDPGK